MTSVLQGEPELLPWLGTGEDALVPVQVGTQVATCLSRARPLAACTEQTPPHNSPGPAHSWRVRLRMGTSSPVWEYTLLMVRKSPAGKSSSRHKAG